LFGFSLIESASKSREVIDMMFPTAALGSPSVVGNLSQRYMFRREKGDK